MEVTTEDTTEDITAAANTTTPSLSAATKLTATKKVTTVTLRWATGLNTQPITTRVKATGCLSMLRVAKNAPIKTCISTGHRTGTQPMTVRANRSSLKCSSLPSKRWVSRLA